MSLPIYKRIKINSAQQKHIQSQLDLLDFGQKPFIFEIAEHISESHEVLMHIEDYLFEHDINTHIYPIFVLSQVSDYLGPLNIIKDTQKLPMYYKHKTKQLNAKENSRNKVVELKQTQLASIRRSDFAPTLYNYSKNHKEILISQRKNHYFESLIARIKKDE